VPIDELTTDCGSAVNSIGSRRNMNGNDTGTDLGRPTAVVERSLKIIALNAAWT